MRIDVFPFSKDGKIWIYVFWFPSVGNKNLESIPTSFDFQPLGIKDVNLRVSISKRWRRKTWIYIFRFPSVGDKGRESRFFVSQPLGTEDERIYVFWFPSVAKDANRFASFVWQLLGTENANLSISKRWKSWIFLARCLRSIVFCSTILGDRIYTNLHLSSTIEERRYEFSSQRAYVPTSFV